MVLCLLVYRLAEHLLRRQLVATEQTLPNQINKPTNRPTMRWIFHCFEGIDLLHIRIGNTGTDRKSTRLNSSHLVISYAVFCLKKKNNTDEVWKEVYLS